MGPGRWARTAAAARRRENAMTSRTAPPTSLPMEAPRGKTPRRYVDRRATAYRKRFGAAHPGLERLAGGAPDQVLGDRFGALQLALVFELELARDGGQRGVDVRDAGDHRLFLRGDRASLRVRHHVLQYADREPL